MNRPIRVLHLITDLSSGGAEMMLYRLLSAMDRDRFASQVISLTSAASVAEMIRGLGVPVETLGMSPGIPSPGGLWRLWRSLRGWQPQVLQTWLYHSDLLGLLAGRIAGTPSIVWNVRCSNVDFGHYRALTRWVVLLCARLSGLPSTVVVNSEAGRQHHLSIGYHPKRWELIPNGFDLARYRPDPTARATLRAELGLSESAPLVGLIARLDPMKDHWNFLQAAAILNRKHPEVHFALCGSGVDRANAQLQGWLDGLGLDPSIHLLGHRDDVPLVAAGLDVACSSSLGEGFPTAVGEAMACGVPCAVTDVGDSAFIVDNTGKVVPPSDPSALAEALGALIELPSEARRELGRAARSRIEERFSLSGVVARYEALYEELVSTLPDGSAH